MYPHSACTHVARESRMSAHYDFILVAFAMAGIPSWTVLNVMCSTTQKCEVMSYQHRPTADIAHSSTGRVRYSMTKVLVSARKWR